MYYIIRKVYSNGSSIVREPIGYVENSIDENYIDSSSTFDNWVESNRQALEDGILLEIEYFDSNPVFYEGSYSTKVIDGMDLKLITDLDNPGGELV